MRIACHPRLRSMARLHPNQRSSLPILHRLKGQPMPRHRARQSSPQEWAMHPERWSLCAGHPREGVTREPQRTQSMKQEDRLSSICVLCVLCGFNLLKRLLLPIAVAVALVACSTPAPKEKAVLERKHETVRPARVDIQQDATGFTIVEDVRVSTDVHAQYENAVRLLEAQQHEQGIGALARAAEA